MKTRISWIVLLVAMMALLTAAWTAYGRTGKPLSQVHYKVMSKQTMTSNSGTLQKSLDDLGQQGWELIAVDKDEYIFKLAN